MKSGIERIKDEVSLRGKCESITMSELRTNPGQVIDSVELGKVFIIYKAGRPIGVLSPLPGESLTKHISSHGDITYTL